MFAHQRPARSSTPGADAGRSVDGVKTVRNRESIAKGVPGAFGQDMVRAVVLTAEEERELGRLSAFEGCEVSRDRLIKGNLRLAAAIAKNYMGRGLSVEAIHDAANAGLVRAAESFDPVHGGRFSMSASWFIKHAIKQALAKAGHLRVPVA